MHAGHFEVPMFTPLKSSLKTTLGALYGGTTMPIYTIVMY